MAIAWRRLSSAALILVLAMAAWTQEKKKRRGKEKEEELPTQTLEIPKEPPAVVTADAERLVFRVTPLSAKGLLSQQVRDALRWLMRQDRNIVKLRAFVAGSGDMRRVQAIVSEMFTERRLPLPALTVVQVGALPLEGAQVVLESIAADRNAVNPNGLAFISGQAASIDQPLAPVAPLVDQSVVRLRTVLHAAGLESNDLLRMTCYLSSLDDLAAVRQRLAPEFPRAALDFVQRTREPSLSIAECEAVARLRSPPHAPVEFLNPPGLAAQEGLSQAALVSARKLALTGAQLAFGFEEPDARLAFQRLGKTLEQAGVPFTSVVVANVYPLSRSIAGLVRKVSADFYDRARPPAGTILPLEGLPSLDASFGMEVVALLPENK